MFEAVLLDRIHGCRRCTGSLPHAQVFWLGGEGLRDEPGSADPSRVLDSGSIAERLYRFKRTLDQLDLSSVRVVTTPRGRDRLAHYQKLLFTAVYTFTYQVMTGCSSPAHTDSPAEGGPEEDVMAVLRQLPALGGPIRVLTSTLIPDGFGHGFSTRAGGVSYIPTLSSLNLFSSSKRRDPASVVQENRQRLAVHAGFHPQPLHLVKVNHASDVWVMGKAEPESYDAVVTDQPDVVLAAPGADCIPILFVDPVSKVIGAAHAGWKGTLMGVAMATVEAMVTEFGCQAPPPERRHPVGAHP
ncbi:purine nucleoside phosphorylase LACC1 isoform 2-T2 [Aulostomus maculatus]